ncbi:MAG: flagellin [Lachnospiraceae bacterium]|nr:flagellin [Lachnospiraceae bacterium]MDE6738146.1 flagellin [Lachnospiraceae bacterium]
MSAMTVSGSGNDIFKSYSHLASGKRINSAADDATGLAIAQKMQREETGLSVGAQNAQAGIGVLNVADGALGGMTDYLQRIRDLALRSMNGLSSADDKQVYQNEIDQLKQGIQSLAKDTSLNEQKLLDGSMADMDIVTNPNGGGMKIQMENATLEALGIADLDVTSGNFDLKAIDKALDMVSTKRSSLGAATNRLEYTYNYNTGAALEQLSSRSRLEDLDFPKAISEKQQKEVMGQYRMMMLRQQMNNKSMITGMLF